MKLEFDLRKDVIKIYAYNTKSPILEIGPLTIYLNIVQTEQLKEGLTNLLRGKGLRR